jgi:hypothetical protein
MKWKILASALTAGLVLLGPWGSQPHGRADATEAPTSVPQACDENPPEGYTQSITGIVDGDPLVLKVSTRFAGAVESLTWRGKEFINTWDHGREISYAWGLDGYSECLNPTEPGTANDYQSLTSSSRLLRACRMGANKLTTTTQLAYWLAPGQSGFCAGGVTTAVNDSVLSDNILEKTMEIGYQGIENVIAFTAAVTLPESHSTNGLEIPTAYLTYEFNDYWTYAPLSGELTKPQTQTIHQPWSFDYFGNLPPILSTQDGMYAMGAYSADPIEGYGIYATDVANPRDRTNKWNIVRWEQPAPAKTYTYRSFVIVGTLAQVQAGMDALFKLHPVDVNPPTGYIDVATCDEIAGWAWDPKTPNQPIDVEFYALNDDDSETLLTRVQANSHRGDLVTALGDNGNHGFNFPAADIIHDNRRVVLEASAVNSNPILPNRKLFGSGQAVECPQFGPPPEPTLTLVPSSEPTLALPSPAGSTLTPTPVLAEPTPSKPGGALPCAGAALPFAFGIAAGIRRRRLSRFRRPLGGRRSTTRKETL